MNERIEKLALRAGVNLSSFQFSGTPIKYEVSESDLEKFARLIVRECGRVYIQNQQDGVMTLTQDLLQHFGVEE